VAALLKYQWKDAQFKCARYFLTFSSSITEVDGHLIELLGHFICNALLLCPCYMLAVFILKRDNFVVKI
jgi:hypothetical protein